MHSCWKHNQAESENVPSAQGLQPLISPVTRYARENLFGQLCPYLFRTDAPHWTSWCYHPHFLTWVHKFDIIEFRLCPLDTDKFLRLTNPPQDEWDVSRVQMQKSKSGRDKADQTSFLLWRFQFFMQGTVWKTCLTVASDQTFMTSQFGNPIMKQIGMSWKFGPRLALQ